MTEQSVKLFISYSHRDEELRHQLDKHLASLKRQNVIDSWHDRKIEAGMEWAKQIDDNLNNADIVLLLISPDFIFSNYCSEIEMEQAIKKHEAGETIVVPIILEPCDWMWLPVSKYQAFPKNAKPITTWINTNEAFLDVIQGIRTVAQRLFEQRQQKFKEKEIAKNRYLKKVEEILSFDGEISIPGQDTLDELREELKLTTEETKQLQLSAFEPYKKYGENLQKYERTFLKVIQQEYPISEKNKKGLKLRQRDLGIKYDDVEKIEKRILAQIKTENRDLFKEEASLKQLEKKSEKINDSQPSLDAIDSNTTSIKSKLKPSIVDLDQQLQSQNEQPLDKIEATSKSSSKPKKSTTIDPAFLERCQQELLRLIGPMGQFIVEETIAEYPEIEPQQLVELLSTEISDPQDAKSFKEYLL
ncbi:MAG TPA: hypothetical protein DCF68_08250 [Cyanothece sp. UBA12306]|nr:hypothetical protein [Cyanothece sp. UBA12306]